jgi:tRNA (mo5U34)-methyltransferase
MGTIEPSVDPSDLRERIAGNHDWYHTLELAPGVLTPGIVDVRPVVQRVPVPASLAGRRCLDIGTWDGFWAFEMERRGAAEVHAVDVPDPYRWDWPARARIRESYDGGKENLEAIRRNGNGFPIAREALRSSVERHEMTVYEISADALGTFDFVFVGSILLHLRDPVGALERIRDVATGEVVFNDCIEYVLTKLWPKSPMARLDDEDRVWWWQPNLSALASMIEQAGFEITERGKPYFVPFGSRYEVPDQGFRDVLRRLRSPRGWEELVLYRRGIAHAAFKSRRLAGAGARS